MPKASPRFTVGLTGGIGTGKSTALGYFRRLGAGTISADDIAHRLSRRGGALHRAVVRAFGARYLDARGNLDRGALAEAVFAKPALRRRLERATHPPILRQMRRDLARLRRPVAVVDVPLLFEAGVQNKFDATLLVTAPERAVMRRIMRRSGLSPRQVRARMRAQMPLRCKETLADIVVRNDGGKNRLARAVREYHQAFQLIARQPSHRPSPPKGERARVRGRIGLWDRL